MNIQNAIKFSEENKAEIINKKLYTGLKIKYENSKKVFNRFSYFIVNAAMSTLKALEEGKSGIQRLENIIEVENKKKPKKPRNI